MSPRPLRSALAAALAAALVAAVLTACSDDPVQPPAARVTGPNRPASAAMPIPGVSTPVVVDVPESMRGAPFDIGRSLTVPANFRIAVHARVPRARFMAVASNGDLLVSRPDAGTVVLVRPSASGGDPEISSWATGLYRPHDIVFHTIGGTTYVYVAEGNKIARYVYTSGDATGQGRQVVISGLPSASTPELRGAYGHELKNIALDGDHRLYVSIASTCNACASDAESDPVRGAIYVYDADGSGGRLFARGLRNAEGLALVPGTNTLWAAVNNRDDIAYPFHGDITGDGADDYGRVVPGYVNDHPPEEFTRVRDGGNYGWPFCNPNPDTPAGLDDMPFDRDVELNANGERLDCDAADRISKGIQAHSAPLGLTFFQGTTAPAAYRTGAAIAYHSSWNRERLTGYKVAFFPWDPPAGAGGAPGTEVDLVTGWGTEFSEAWGQPVDVAVDPSGRCLDVLGAGRNPWTPLIIYGCHGGENQRFTLPAPGATGEIRVYGGMCVNAAGGSAGGFGSNGDRIIVWPCHGGANQQWTRAADGALVGINGRCLDVEGARTDDFTPVILWDCHGESNQRWDAGG